MVKLIPTMCVLAIPPGSLLLNYSHHNSKSHTLSCSFVLVYIYRKQQM
jgi:hypothetical protein